MQSKPGGKALYFRISINHYLIIFFRYQTFSTY